MPPPDFVCGGIKKKIGGGAVHSSPNIFCHCQHYKLIGGGGGGGGGSDMGMMGSESPNKRSIHLLYLLGMQS